MNLKIFNVIKIIGFVLLPVALVIGVVFVSTSPSGPPTGAVPPTPTPPANTGNKLSITDFDAVHAPVNGDDEKYVIFGNLTAPTPAANLPPELAAFLGRWEGYSFSPPVQKDYKYVLFVQEITAQGGKAFFWAGTNLQYPICAQELEFSVSLEDTPTIRLQCDDRLGPTTFKFSYDRDKNQLQGWQKTALQNDFTGPIELSRSRSFYVYKDYARYLAEKRIYPREYQNKRLQDLYGQGYLLYLPEGYETHPQQTWPLIIFLHGTGDRGDNVFLLAKASPFMMILEHGPLPFIIVAPLLKQSESSFPNDYMNGVLEEILAGYHIDPQRIYVTGLSMGGEATYRFAAQQPKRFAAIAPLAAFLSSPVNMEPIKDLPVWAIRGEDDRAVSLARGQQPVDELKLVGGDVRFSILENHDHDVWTDTYSDPQFYAWLFQHQRSSNWLDPVFQIGAYFLIACLIWSGRDHLADFNIDKLALCIVILFKPLQSIILALGASGGDPLAFPNVGGLAFWIIAAGLFLALWRSRPRLAQFSRHSVGWFGLGILAGLFTVILLRYPMSVQITYGRPLDGIDIAMLLGQAAPGFFYQLGYAAVTEEALFRGFLWGYLQKAGWKNVWIWLFQAGLLMVGNINTIYSSPIFFWVIVPTGALVSGVLVWRSKTISSSLAAHAAINTFGYVIGYIISLLN